MSIVTAITGFALGVVLVLLCLAKRRIRELEAPQKGWEDFMRRQ